jgi:dCMP deaminase
MQKQWIDVWFEVAEVISQRSRCSRAQIGAVIVNGDQRIISTGYNNPARGFQPSDGECLEWCERAQGKTGLGSAYDGCPSIHAESNALLYVDRSSIQNGTIYITAPPCMQCAKLISNSGLSTVRCLIGEEDSHRNPEVVIEYLENCGIKVITHNRH